MAGILLFTTSLTLLYRFGQDKRDLTNLENSLTKLDKKVDSTGALQTKRSDEINTALNKRLDAANLRIDSTNKQIGTVTDVVARVEQAEAELANAKKYLNTKYKLNYEHIGSVFFYRDKTRESVQLSETAKADLKNMKEIFDSRKLSMIYIQGTIARSADNYTINLFNSRVKAVRDYLKELGVPESKMQTSPFLDHNPLHEPEKQGKNNTDKSRDNRVDITILEDTMR